jgi:hypothetical protein
MDNKIIQDIQSQYHKRYDDGYIIEEDAFDNDATYSLIKTYYSKDDEILKRITIKKFDSNEHIQNFHIEIIDLFTDGVISSKSTEIFENNNKTEVVTFFYYKDTEITQTSITNNLINDTTTILSYFKNGSIRGKTEYIKQELISKIMYNDNGTIRSVV